MNAAPPMLLDEAQHAAALERLAVQALAEGDLAAAWRHADRRCRIAPVAGAHHFTLRADASYRVGAHREALVDLARALELEPDDLAANRRMLAWAVGEAQQAAARILLRRDTDPDVLATAIRLLKRPRGSAFAGAAATDAMVTGWAAWAGTIGPKVTIEDGDRAEVTTVEENGDHPLAACLGHAASFALARPRSAWAQTLRITLGRRTLFDASLRPNDMSQGRALPFPLWENEGEPDACAGGRPTVTVVVPVYSDYESTKTCLNSVAAELARVPAARAIVVNDATPEPRIAALAAQLSGIPAFTSLTNPRNLGFAGAVNRALNVTPHGDVVLLNADTVLPPGSLARLAAAARSAPDIGTATPLSNNGDFTSFPVPFRINPLPSYDEICFIDQAAAAANDGHVIDMPNGIGFCLYITRACLDAVGPLCADYQRGYLEDVEFCLRAAALGFRNVCAASVFIGHASTRPFAADRRSPGVQNINVVETRFPRHWAACAAFVAADPLRTSRAAVEHALAGACAGAHLVVSGAGGLRPAAEARARELCAQGTPALIVECRTIAGGHRIGFINPTQGLPQSLAFDLPRDRAALSDFLGRAKPARVEIADPKNTPANLLGLRALRGVPFDLLVLDAGLGCRRGTFLGRDGQVCSGLEGSAPCGECLSADGKSRRPEAWQRRCRAMARRAERILAPDPRAQEFATRFLVDRSITEWPVAAAGDVTAGDAPAVEQDDMDGPWPRYSFGILAAGDNAAEHCLMRNLIQELRRHGPVPTLVVIGRTLDDLGLMRLGGVCVTGTAEPGEHPRILRQYGVRRLLLGTRRPLFGHPAIAHASARSQVPLAFFDWSLGKIPARPGDLALDPRADDAEVAAALIRWWPAQAPMHERESVEAAAS